MVECYVVVYDIRFSWFCDVIVFKFISNRIFWRIIKTHRVFPHLGFYQTVLQHRGKYWKKDDIMIIHNRMLVELYSSFSVLFLQKNYLGIRSNIIFCIEKGSSLYRIEKWLNCLLMIAWASRRKEKNDFLLL